jgi:hypothetical protein
VLTIWLTGLCVALLVLERLHAAAFDREDES